MFSGIVEELGTVAVNRIGEAGRLDIRASAVVADAQLGDSIAVNGCCLTVVEVATDGFTVDVMPETARLTNLNTIGSGDPVNLEAALRMNDRIGGHLVTGHIDAVGTIADRREEGNAVWITVVAPAAVVRHMVARGCIAVEGISLTVVGVEADRFTVSLIPHTVAQTTARGWQPGTRVNLESDLMAKYVANAVAALRDGQANVNQAVDQ